MGSSDINNKIKVQVSGLNTFKPGMKKAEAKTSAQKSIFNALDKNGDGVISKSEAQNGIVKGKVKNSKGQLVEREYAKLKDLPNGRSLVVDQNGKQWVRAHDGVILKEEYVKNNFKTPTKTTKTTKTTPQNITKTTNFLAKQFNSAQKAFNAQMEKDGWAGDLADGISRAWTWATDSKNSANYVRKDLKNQKKNVQDLQKAAKQGDAQFKAKFKEIYGINYNQAAMDAYMADPSEANYKKAFGSKVKNIKTRVDKYNQSQDTGAVAVKTTAKVGAGIAIGVATGGTGFVALGAAAAATTVASVVIEESDALKVTDAVTKGKIKFREGTDHKKILKDAAWDGASVLAGGAVGKVAGTVIKGTSKMATVGRATMNVAGDVAIGAAQEYATTGEVTAMGVATNAVMSGVGGAVVSGTLKGVSKGYSAIKKGFNKIADNVPHRFSTKKAELPAHLFDENGNMLAGGVSEKSGGGFFSRLKNRVSNIVSTDTPVEAAIRAKNQQALDNGLEEAIAQGKVNADILDRMNAPGSRASISDATVGYTVSDRLVEALKLQKNGNSFVSQLADNINPANISQHIPDGGVASINGKLYINDGGVARPIKMSQEKFDRLFDPMKLATMTQDGGTHICVATSQINSMLETPSGRARLFTMIEDTGNGMVVNLSKGQYAKPIMFPDGKPVKMNGRFMTDAPDGVQMIEQAFMASRIKRASIEETVDISSLSAQSLKEQATDITNRRTLSDAALDIGGIKGQIVRTKKNVDLRSNRYEFSQNVRDDLEKMLNDFVPGKDVMTCHWGGHAKSVVNYDPTTQIVTYRDPMVSGVDTQCTFNQFMNKGSHDYGLEVSLQKRATTPGSSTSTVSAQPKNIEPNVSTKEHSVPKAESKSTQPKSIAIQQKTQADTPQAVQPRNVATSESNFVSKTTELSNRAMVVTRTADGTPIGASITQSNVFIKRNGTSTLVPIPKNGNYTAVKVNDGNASQYLIIKNENGKVSITTTDIELPKEGAISSLTNGVTSHNSATRVTSSKPQPTRAAQPQKQRVESSYNNSTTSSKPVSAPTNPSAKTATPAAPPIPNGFRKYTEGAQYMGKPTIINNNNEIMYLSNGVWKKPRY